LELSRDVYKKMLDWKKKRDEADRVPGRRKKALCLEGPRQVGKTWLADKFGEENYRIVVKINVLAKTDMLIFESFVKTHVLRGKEFWDQLLATYSKDFVDSPETLVIIDEIQDNVFFYNSIRDILGNCNFHLLISGSYLGFIYKNKEFFIPIGDLNTIVVNAISFPEYLKIVGEYDRYMGLDLFGKSNKDDYEAISACYDDYVLVGGYPEITSAFLDGLDRSEIDELQNELYEKIVNEIWKCVETVDLWNFKKIYADIPRFLLTEKMDRPIDCHEFVMESYPMVLDYSRVESAVFWMTQSGVLIWCDRARDCDLGKIEGDSRLYFHDIGMASSRFRKATDNARNQVGIISENFVFLAMDRLDPDLGLSHRKPVFGTLGNREIDFLHYSRVTKKTFAADVKYGEGSSKSAKALLNAGKVDYILYVRKSTCGGRQGKILTIPIYLMERFDFDADYDDHSQASRKFYGPFNLFNFALS
jgi:predicted AAA+ superfamily ATPase